MKIKKSFFQIYMIILLVVGFFLTISISSESKAQMGTMTNNSQTAQPTYIPGPQVIGSGCIMRATGTNHLHFATAGQAIVGNAHGANNILHAGFWHMQESMTTGVNAIEETSLRKSFELHQNYPNPFNPSTTISYQLPKKCQVSLSVYNTSGQLIDNLVSENKYPGEYSVLWEVKNLSSGIYLYKLVAGEYVSTKKMLVVK